MTDHSDIRGCLTALVSPFRDDFVDEQAFMDFVEWQIASGVHGLVPCGTTGESPTLTDMEHKRLVEMTVEVANGRVPVVAGAGSNETRVAVAYAARAKSAGADAALVVTPYYNKPSQAGIIAHFQAIVDVVEIPIIVYNIPGRSVIDITNATMAELARMPTVVGVKDATGDIGRVVELTDLCGEDFIQLSGDDPTSVGHRAQGGHGCISVGSNVAPSEYAQLHDHMSAGQWAEATALNRRLHGLHVDLFADPSPAPTKYALAEMGKMTADVRLPITPCREEVERLVGRAVERAHGKA